MAVASSRNLQRVLALNGRESGATVFIVGSGPQLNDLTREHHKALATVPTIGVNRTQYALRLSYFISAYPAEVILARMHCGSETTVIHLRPKLEHPLVRNTLTIRRVRHQQGQALETSFTAPDPTLHTFKNVALAATHFALVLGAARVVYLGVEQTSALHFYDLDPSLRRQMLADIRRIRARSILAADHPYATLDHLIDKLDNTPSELEARDFYVTSHRDTFREFFDELRRHGCEVFATKRNSVVAEAGADVVEIKEALAW